MEKIKRLGKNLQKFNERGIEKNQVREGNTGTTGGILSSEVTTAVLGRSVECRCIRDDFTGIDCEEVESLLTVEILDLGPEGMATVVRR